MSTSTSSDDDQVVAAGARKGGSRGPAPGGRSPRIVTAALVALAALAVTVFAAVLLTRNRAGSQAGVLRPSGIPASVSTDLANLMQLSPLPHEPAPGFTLTDQAGHSLSLASLRGKVVVLEFMDPHCTDICPIVSQEFVGAHHDLGPAADQVVFVAVNVNSYHHSVADVAAFSREHALTTIPDWHFFTGQVAALRSVWQAYHIDVQASNPDADVVHTSAVYFIDRQGREAFLAQPMVDHTSKGDAYLPANQIADWAKGIALVARHLAS